MAVYSEVLPNDVILRKILALKDVDRILIIGCGGCMNESLAYKNNLPVYLFENGGEKEPFSTLNELEKIKEYLETNDYSVDLCIIKEGTPILCIYSDDYEFEFYTDNNIPSIILALCCPAGIVGLRAKLDSNIPIVCITFQKGILAYSFIDSNGKRDIILKNSRILNHTNGK